MDKTMTVSQIVGLHLRELRESRGWTQKQLADHLNFFCGWSLWPQSVGAAEAGERRWSAEEIVQLATTLHVPVSGLLLPPDDVTKVETSTGFDIPFPKETKEEVARFQLHRAISMLRQVEKDLEAPVEEGKR